MFKWIWRQISKSWSNGTIEELVIRLAVKRNDIELVQNLINRLGRVLDEIRERQS